MVFAASRARKHVQKAAHSFPDAILDLVPGIRQNLDPYGES